MSIAYGKQDYTKHNPLLIALQGLKKSKIKRLVNKRIKEFSKLGKGSANLLFKELCFCILTANYDAERTIIIHKKIGDGFLKFEERELAEQLRRLGYRFPNIRAKYIIAARKYKNPLKAIVGLYKDGKEVRGWIVKNIKGLGYKEASHFLRNIGYRDVAIIDFHILNILSLYGLVDGSKFRKTISKKKYLEIEKILEKLAKKSNLNLAELDLYLWYMETGKVLR